MLKRFWRWFYGEPDPDTTLEMMRIIVENQQKSQEAMMDAVTATIEASEKQAEVLGKYLDLFKQPGDTSAWVEKSPSEAGSAEMIAMGFDPTWSEAAQAEWVLAHLDKL